MLQRPPLTRGHGVKTRLVTQPPLLLQRQAKELQLGIGNDGRDLELDTEALNPRTEVGPNLADVSGHGNGNTTSADGLGAIFQLEAIKTVTRATGIDVVRKPGHESQAPSTVGNVQTMR